MKCTYFVIEQKNVAQIEQYNIAYDANYFYVLRIPSQLFY